MLPMPKLRNGVIAALLACSAIVAMPAAGAQESASASMSRNIRILASDPRNFDALIGAGRAALDMGDIQSAAGFFGRAQELRPEDWKAVAGVGAAMAQTGDAAGALNRFEQAARLGAPIGSYAIDRGLARDLLGDSAGAQADYRLALGGPNEDEARRRLALSLAISRKKREAIDAIQPLLNRRDPGAQRSRAFVLALAGDRKGASEAIEAVMPGTASQFEKFFRYLPNLSAAEKAAAVHLGLFPEDASTRVAEAEQVDDNSLDGVASAPVQVAQRTQASPPLNQPPKATGSTAKQAPGQKTRVIVRSDTPTSARKTLQEESRDKETRAALAARAQSKPSAASPPAPAPSFQLPSQGEPPASPMQAEPEPLVPVDTSSNVPVEAAVEGSVVDLPSGASGPVLPAEEVRLSGIDKLLATLADPAPPPKPKVDDRAAKAAAAKKAADKKAAEAKAAAEKKAREEAAKLGTPGTHWVQLAGGSNRDNMAAEYRRLERKSAQLKRRSGYVSAGKDYFRLLVGPFNSKSEAQAFVNKLAKDGVDGFSWTRTPAQIKIEKLP